MDVIEVQGLEKRYGARQALAGVDLAVRAGEIVAVLGPNGAGKSTLLEVLEGHRKRDAGRVRVLGEDPARGRSEWRARLGIVLQEQGVIEELTAREALVLYGGYYPRRRDPDELLALVGLTDRARDRVDRLSGGAQRRLDLALGLVGAPELLFLDEPTTGFDPDARRRSWSVIESVRAAGTTVVLTTHYLEEAATLADRLVVLDAGRIVAEGTAAELSARRTASLVRFRVPADGPLPRLSRLERSGPDGVVEITSADPARDLAQVCAWALDHGLDLGDLTVSRPSLEDVYLDLIGAGSSTSVAHSAGVPA
jgi:ABC-2 type transport system ATP-binding protein